MVSTGTISGHPFDDPEYVLRMLERFRRIDWTGKSFNHIIHEYRRTLFAVPVYPLKVNKGTVVFRGRRNDKEDERLFQHVNELGLREPEKVVSFGRANIPGQSVFYASSNEQTVVREVTQWYVNDTGRFQDLISKGVLGMGWNPATCMMTISA